MQLKNRKKGLGPSPSVTFSSFKNIFFSMKFEQLKFSRNLFFCFCLLCHSLHFSSSVSCQTLQMGISHFSGLFLLLCIGVGGALLTLAGEHGFYQLVLPHIRRRQNLKYWLHTSQVRVRVCVCVCVFTTDINDFINCGVCSRTVRVTSKD